MVDLSIAMLNYQRVNPIKAIIKPPLIKPLNPSAWAMGKMGGWNSKPDLTPTPASSTLGWIPQNACGFHRSWAPRLGCGLWAAILNGGTGVLAVVLILWHICHGDNHTGGVTLGPPLVASSLMFLVVSTATKGVLKPHLCQFNPHVFLINFLLFLL